MRKRATQLPGFETDEEESAFWEEESPLDYVQEPVTQKVRVKVPSQIATEKKELSKNA